MDERNNEELIQQFRDLTGITRVEAIQYLTASQWDLSNAVTEYFTIQEEGAEEGDVEGNKTVQETKPYTGPRTLDGRPAPESTSTIGSSSRLSATKSKKSGIATLGSISQSQPSRDNFDGSDDEDLNHGKEPRDLFAGGEKSGLAVQDPAEHQNHPKKVVRDILKMAKANAARLGGEGGEPSAATPSFFRGNGQTLGGDDTPSRIIPNTEQPPPEVKAARARTLHLWEDGFSIEDGPLRRFDDPQNAADLQMIRQGRAPVHLMGVRENEHIDVQLINHDENYKAPPKVYKPFSGTANRLGSPIPGSTVKPQTPISVETETSISDPKLDSSQPVIKIRIQLADGTRLPAQFNPTHTIGDIYEFIERASPTSNSRPWVLATTFPTKNHTEKSKTLEEIPELKRGGTAVQKTI